MYARWLFPVILLLTAGCNSDIFIEGEDFPDDSWVTVSVGETAYFNFPTDGLVEVRADFHGKYNCVKYVSTGEVFATYRDVGWMSLYDASTTQPFITRLTAENDNVSFELTGSPNGDFAFTSKANTLGEDTRCSVTVSYNYGKAFCITFIMPSTGEPPVYKVKELIYDSPLKVSLGSRHYEQTVLLNATDNAVMDPYSVDKLCRLEVHFQLSTDLTVMKGLDTTGFEAPIPTYSGAQQQAALYGVKVPFVPGSQLLPPLDSSLIDGGSFYKVYEVNVPAMTGVYASVEADMVGIGTYAGLVAVNMTTGEERIFTVRVDVIQARAYTIEFKEDNTIFKYE